MQPACIFPGQPPFPILFFLVHVWSNTGFNYLDSSTSLPLGSWPQHSSLVQTLLNAKSVGYIKASVTPQVPGSESELFGRLRQEGCVTFVNLKPSHQCLSSHTPSFTLLRTTSQESDNGSCAKKTSSFSLCLTNDEDSKEKRVRLWGRRC